MSSVSSSYYPCQSYNFICDGNNRQPMHHDPFTQQATITNLCAKPIRNLIQTDSIHISHDNESDSDSDMDSIHPHETPTESSFTFNRRLLHKLSLNELLAKALTLKSFTHWNMDNEWCRYCGARASSAFLNSPWGQRKLCYLHHKQWKYHQLNLSMYTEPMHIEQAINKSKCTEKRYLIDIILSGNKENSNNDNTSTHIKIKKEPFSPICSPFSSLSDSDMTSVSGSESFHSSCSSCSMPSDYESRPTSSGNITLKMEPISTTAADGNTYNLFESKASPELLSSPLFDTKLSNNMKLRIKTETMKEKESEWKRYLSLPIECRLCYEWFPSHTQFQHHMDDIHDISQAYRCLRCPSSNNTKYANRAGLFAHIERDHDMIRPFHCKLCKKSFYRKAQLDRHQRVHDGQKPFKCSYCDIYCSQKSSLRQHVIAVHLKQRNYKCRYCRKAFAASTTMKSHMVSIHADDKYARYECNVCHKKFYIRGHYLKHLRIAHRPTDPIQDMIKNGHCPYADCNKQYTSKNKASSVRYHLVATHKDRRYANYECTLCDKLFYDKTNYTQHCQLKHNNNRLC